MWTWCDSPVGELRIVGDGTAVTALDFDAAASGDAAPRTSMAHHRARLADRDVGERADDDHVLRETGRQLTAYFARELKDFDLPLAPVGSVFQLRVWELLREIGYGSTATYGELAARLGMTGHGARAVGLANGRNPIPIIVPCHRVVGADGSLTGYGGGIERKLALLDLERDGLF